MKLTFRIPLQATLCAALITLPLMAQGLEITVRTDNPKPPYKIQYGERDPRGWYWDGATWRDPDYWHRHHGKGKGNPHAPGQDCPPGQAKKGRC